MIIVIESMNLPGAKPLAIQIAPSHHNGIKCSFIIGTFSPPIEPNVYTNEDDIILCRYNYFIQKRMLV